jgi:putative redox protein
VKIRVISALGKDIMKNNIKQSKRQFPFELKNERGHLVNVDSRPEYGGNDASPMELVLMDVAPLI